MRSWAWTVAAVHSLRQALCPALTLTQLIAATAAGTLDVPERRRRRSQLWRLRALLRDWILG